MIFVPWTRTESWKTATATNKRRVEHWSGALDGASLSCVGMEQRHGARLLQLGCWRSRDHRDLIPARHAATGGTGRGHGPRPNVGLHGPRATMIALCSKGGYYMYVTTIVITK